MSIIPASSARGPQKALVVIPAWNEAYSIGQVIQSVHEVYDRRVLVVDDASDDDTALLAKSAGAAVIHLPMNLGAWTAIQTGFRYALAKGFNSVLTMDADGQHFAESIPRLLDELASGDYDVIIGANISRATRCRQISWSFFRLLTAIALEDFTSGLKAYNERAMRLLLRPRAHLFDYQDLGALLLMRQFGLNIKEIRVPMQNRLHGHSRVFSNWWQVSRYMLLSTALCISKFHCLEIDQKPHGGFDDTDL